jgi:hypothetical protein
MGNERGRDASETAERVAEIGAVVTLHDSIGALPEGLLSSVYLTPD